ncbi:MAG: RodZ domain-containing protein, partial [Marinobacter sp.]
MNDETEVSDRLPEPLAAEPANEMLIDEPAEEVAATDTSDAAEPLAEDAGLQSSAGEPAVSADSTDPVEPLQAPLEPAQTPDVDQAAAVSSAGRLEMTFRGDCWIKVTDATGERLASGLRRQGDKLDVRGTPPLNVVVGAMSAVEVIQFQNEILDKGNFRVVNNRSEFTLEP